MILFDTSVLIAATIQTHPFHEKSRRAVVAVKEKRTKGMICQHTIAEFFNTLTRYKAETPATPAQAEQIILKHLLPIFKVISLTQRDYLAAAKRVKDQGLRGPVIYDALILQAAVKAKAFAICTLNTYDFLRLIKDEMDVQEPT